MLAARRLLIALFAFGALLLPARALEVTPYTPQVLAAAQASGEPFLLDFFATWCSTCKAQDRVIHELAAQDSAYDSIHVIRVDWDEEERGALVRDLAIPRRSTLVVMEGTAELGRLVAATGKDQIAALLDLAVGR
jgi:thioredoxin 1